ncbi:MAG: tol-pal system protein YbgF [Rhizobiales bacterium]|nr:tol-pal system protein YbgF [Hyphomicrobiales bacterium]
MAQVSEADLVVRLDRLENYLRQLTGAIEQLQFRNQQLEQALRKTQEDNEYRFQELGGRAAAGPPRPATQPPGRPQPAPSALPPAPPPQPGRRSDVFDPAQNPDAPGAPRQLGGGTVIAGMEPQDRTMDVPPVGVSGGREPGAPLDLTTVAQPAPPEAAANPPGASPGAAGLPPPPPRNTSATGAVAAVQPPTQSPKDEYDLAFGYMLRKDYALAEAAFQNFLRQHPGDRRTAEATYWLGESMFQRQRFRDAAESFLAVTTKHEKSTKGPDALFRLGQSLAALGEMEAACAALGEVGRKYPRASAGVRQGVEREQKRVRC